MQELLQAGGDDDVTLAVAKNNLAADRMRVASTGPQQKRLLADSLKHLDSLMAKVSSVSAADCDEVTPCILSAWQSYFGNF